MIETQLFLKRWLINHILKEDMDIGDFMRNRAMQIEKYTTQAVVSGELPPQPVQKDHQENHP